MIQNDPLVSIVIPTFNRAHLIGETLDSVVAQTYQNWECIVVDDGSTDDTESVVANVVSSDNRMRYSSRDRLPAGASTCRNIGLSMSMGKYVIFLDSDDLLAPWCLERRVEVMEQEPGIDFAVFLTKVFFKTPDDSPYFWSSFNDADDLERFFRFGPPWCTFAPIWRVSSLAGVAPWNEQAKSWQDWEFHVRALSIGLKYIKVNEPDSYCRESHPGSISTRSKQRPFIVNRARILPKVLSKAAIALRERGALTTTRRRLMAALLYQLAFSSELSRKKTAAIWQMGYRSKVVNLTEFLIILACRHILGRIPWKIRIGLFPEVRKIGRETNHMRITERSPGKVFLPDSSGR